MVSSPKEKSLNFEKALKELEQTVDILEQDNLSLEDSVKRFEHGIKLIKLCQQALDQAEKKINILVEKDGSLKLENFENGKYTDTEELI